MSDIPLVPEATQPLPRFNEKTGLLSWVATVDHKLLGIMYITAGLVFLVVTGLEALLMRIQLGSARNTFLSPEIYNQIFTMHGTTGVFLAVVPLLVGFSIYVVPLQIGCRDMAFPRINSLGFWITVFGGLMIYYSFIAGGAPNAGWFAYAPLSEKAYNTTTGMDFWALGLLLVGVGTTAAGVNLVVTILCLRAPGMRLFQVPMFTWTSLINGFLIIITLPPLNAALVMLTIDRQLNAHFFTPQSGGSAILWQHYFWAFGHPEVYVLILPAFGMISEIIPVFSRKPLFGYTFVAASTVAIFFLSYIVYAHHMFAVGLGHLFEAAFAASTSLIAIPTGIKIFNWCFTMVGGKLRFTTPMLYAIGFIITFTLGGISGVTFAVVPTDWQTTDSYYLVAHFHYVVFGGSAFAILGGIAYWFPKITGRMLSERLGRIGFGLTFVGFHLTFGIQHILGFMGMPRRVYSYPDLTNWSLFNLISTIGAFVLASGVLTLVINMVYSLRKGPLAGDDPWDAWTLEWATSSPPPIENFQQLPPIRGRRPLWDLKHPDNQDWMQAAHGHSGKQIKEEH
ncbi:MAG TPA: cytochrome c oxidase subunit I [Chloroflexia bacterium]|nr:cytochrome c oxidase subunit I [Chloroflexia bacterium]